MDFYRAMAMLKQNAETMKELAAFQEHYASLMSAAMHIIEMRNEGPGNIEGLYKAITDMAKVLETPCVSPGSQTCTSTSSDPQENDSTSTTTS
jgi:hypothetical protein